MIGNRNASSPTLIGPTPLFTLFLFLYNNLYRQVNVLLWRHQWRKFRRERMNVYITSKDIRWTSVTSHQAHAHPPTIVVFFVDPQQPPGGNQEKKKRLSCQCCKSLYTSDSTSAYGQQSKWVNHMQIPATHKQPDNTHTHTRVRPNKIQESALVSSDSFVISPLSSCESTTCKEKVAHWAGQNVNI